MEKIINKLINDFTEGVDTYTHNGSTWLIFTESKQWVIELTDGKTLWYNYNFFKGIFSYTSMDVVDNQQYITKWVEDNIINKVSDIRFRDARDNKHQFEDTLQNGVKETYLEVNITEGEVDDIIQDGVRHTKMAHMKTDWSVEDTIENGVKETQFNDNENKSWVEGVIKKGVKETKSDDFNVSQFLCEEVIDKGVKETKYHMSKLRVDAYKTVDNGVKETNHVDVMKFFNNKMKDTLKNGVKETKQKKNALLILDTSGRELILESHLVVRDGVKETSHRQFLKTYDVKDTTQDGTQHYRWILDGCDDPVDVVLDNGVKITTPLQSREYTGDIDEVLGNGVRSSIPRQYVGGDIVDKVIDKGVIETHDDVYHHKGRIDGVIKNGVKKTMSGNYNIPGEEFYITDQYLVDEVLENGVKKTMAGNYTDPSTSLLYIRWEAQIEDVIDNGNKVCGTYVGGHRQEEKTETVIEYGKQI